MALSADGAFQIETDVAFVGDAHRPVQMDRAAANLGKGRGNSARAFAARMASSAALALLAFVKPRAALTTASAGEFRVGPHVDEPVLYDLEAGDRLAELHTIPGVGDRHFECATGGGPASSAASARRARGTMGFREQVVAKLGCLRQHARPAPTATRSKPDTQTVCAVDAARPAIVTQRREERITIRRRRKSWRRRECRSPTAPRRRNAPRPAIGSRRHRELGANAVQASVWRAARGRRQRGLSGARDEAFAKPESFGRSRRLAQKRGGAIRRSSASGSRDQPAPQRFAEHRLFRQSEAETAEFLGGAPRPVQPASAKAAQMDLVRSPPTARRARKARGPG